MLRAYRLVSEHGSKRWSEISRLLGSKGPKQCRRRWGNHLNANNKTESWSPQEDALLLDAHARLGNRWTELARLVGGRTDNAVKNRFDSLVRKRRRAEAAAVGGSDGTTQVNAAANAANAATASTAGSKRRRLRGGAASGSQVSTLAALADKQQHEVTAAALAAVAMPKRDLSIQIPSAPGAAAAAAAVGAQGSGAANADAAHAHGMPPSLATYLKQQLSSLSPVDLNAMGSLASPDLMTLCNLFGVGEHDHLPSGARGGGRALRSARGNRAMGSRQASMQAAQAPGAPGAARAAVASRRLQSPVVDPDEVMGWLRAITPRGYNSGEGSGRSGTCTHTNGGGAYGGGVHPQLSDLASSAQGSVMSPPDADAVERSAVDALLSTSPRERGMLPPSALGKAPTPSSTTAVPQLAAAAQAAAAAAQHAQQVVARAARVKAEVAAGAATAATTPAVIPTPTSGAEMLMKLAEQPGGLAVVHKLLLLCNATPTGAELLNMHHTGFTPAAAAAARAGGIGGGIGGGSGAGGLGGVGPAGETPAEGGPNSGSFVSPGSGGGFGLTPGALHAAAVGAAVGHSGCGGARRSPRLRSAASLGLGEADALHEAAQPFSPGFSGQEAEMLLTALGADGARLMAAAVEPAVASLASVAPTSSDAPSGPPAAAVQASGASFQFDARVFSPRRSPRNLAAVQQPQQPQPVGGSHSWF